MNREKQELAQNGRFVSIVVPALNEETAIQRFVEWCQEGLKKANVAGEIVIVDSSTDRTAEIAEAAGARVLRVPRRGLGQAYIEARSIFQSNNEPEMGLS